MYQVRCFTDRGLNPIVRPKLNYMIIYSAFISYMIFKIGIQVVIIIYNTLHYDVIGAIVRELFFSFNIPIEIK